MMTAKGKYCKVHLVFLGTCYRELGSLLNVSRMNRTAVEQVESLIFHKVTEYSSQKNSPVPFKIKI